MRTLLFAALALLAGACARAPAGPVLVRVNGESITQGQLEQERAFLQPLAPPDEDLLEDLIDQALILQEARRDGIQLDGLGRRNAEELARAGTDPALLEAGLRARGLSLQRWNQRVQRAALIDEVVRLQVRRRVSISPQEVQDHYWEHLPRYRSPERRVLRQIFTRSRSDIEKAERELELGDAFAEVARRRGQGPEAAAGGLLNPLTSAQLPDALAKALRGLKAGQRTRPLHSPWGWHILLLDSRLPATSESLDQAAPQAQAEILKVKEQAVYQAWLAHLREQAAIERLRTPAPAAPTATPANKKQG